MPSVNVPALEGVNVRANVPEALAVNMPLIWKPRSDVVETVAEVVSVAGLAPRACAPPEANAVELVDVIGYTTPAVSDGYAKRTRRPNEVADVEYRPITLNW